MDWKCSALEAAANEEAELTEEEAIESLALTHDKNGPYKELFLKFGTYRVNSNCDITQKYTKVRFNKQ